MNKLILLIIFAMFFSCKETNKKQSESNTSIEANVELNKKEVEKITDEYKVVGWRSNISWRANKIMLSHAGKITVNSGNLKMNEDKIVSGVFGFDMNTLRVETLKGKDRENLENILKGGKVDGEGHFFNVKKFPEATFEITKSYKKNESNYIGGKLTMNGVTENIHPFVVNFEDFPDDASKVWLTSKNFNIDRILWDINFGSKLAFEGLTDDLIIRDNVSVRLKVLLKKIK